MIILCNENNINKEKVRDLYKIIVSYKLKKMLKKKVLANCVEMNQFIPKDSLIKRFITSDISLKKYYNKASNAYAENENIAASLSVIALAHEKQGNIVVACSSDEESLMFSEVLAKTLLEVYGIEYCRYSDLKSRDKKKDKKKSKNSAFARKEKIRESIKEFQDIISDSVKTHNKKKAKKAKKKGKKVDYNWSDDDAFNFENDDSLKHIVKLVRNK